MRLIDADALIRHICGERCGCEPHECGMEHDGIEMCDCVNYIVENAPTIKAEPMQSVTTIWTDGEPPVYAPVRHGKWIEDSLGDCCYKCSECGFVRDAYLLEVETYCPNCGAKMDGAIERVKYGEPNFPW